MWQRLGGVQCGSSVAVTWRAFLSRSPSLLLASVAISLSFFTAASAASLSEASLSTMLQVVRSKE